MKNVILTDYEIQDQWEFQRALEYATKECWTVIKSVNNLNHTGIIKNLIRYFDYFSVPFFVLLKKDQFKTVVAWQQFYGIILGFYLKLFRIKNAPSIYVMTFIYREKKSVVGKLYRSFISYALSSEHIKKCIVFSNSEKEYYAAYFKKKDLFVPEILGIEDVRAAYESEISNGDFYLAPGRSNRDYSFLQTAWSGRSEILKIVCDKCKGKNTDNIWYLTKCYGDDYYRELARCKAVIVPLQDEHISSGQLVILQAMMFGKPLIVTRNDAVSDYVNDLYDGLVIEKSKEALAAAMEWIKESDHYEFISYNARKRYVEKFSLEALGINVGKRIRTALQ